jgi:TonB family protein
MRAHHASSPWGLVAALALMPVGAAAQSPSPDTSATLTPAAVALFSETPQLPGTQRLLTTALASPDPDVRRLAARVARSTNSVAQLSVLQRALDTEPEDSPARGEMESALQALRGARPTAETASAMTAADAPLSSPFSAVATNPRVRLLPWVVATLARDILQVTGCKLAKDTPFIAAHIDYRPTGTIAKAALESRFLSESCQRVGRVLSMLIVAPWGPIEPGVKEIVVMAFDPEWLECLEGRVTAAKRTARGVVRVGEAGVTAPQKMRNVNPVYPARARSERVQGIVVLEALITTEGCVSELGVARSVHPQLDFAALRAVMGWRYAPALVDGVPAPVFMTVTVNFTLQP